MTSALFATLVCAAQTNPLYAVQVPRNTAKKSVEQSIAEVRKNLNINPDLLEEYLVDMLARPIGDDPRVLELCHEVIEKSSGTQHFQAVLMAISTIAHEHLGVIRRSRRKAEIAQVAKQIMVRGEWSTKHQAASFLLHLGDEYANEGERHYIAILQSPNPAGTTSTETRNEAYQRAIRALIDYRRKAAYPLIRESTSRYGLLDRFKRWLAADPQKRMASSNNKKFIKDWEQVMEESQWFK